MPHQCVRCNKLFSEGSNELLKGCDNCGGKFFFFIKQNQIDEVNKVTRDLSSEDKQQIEQDVMNIIGVDIDHSMPVFLDFESVRVVSPGKYELDIVNLFRDKPIVYRVEEGKYIIDIKSKSKDNKNE